MNNPSGCATIFGIIILTILLAVMCAGTFYLFQSDEVGGAISDVGESISGAVSQLGMAVLYIGIGVMGLLLLVGLGLGIERAGKGSEPAGVGIAKARLAEAAAKAIEEGRAEGLPPVWTVLLEQPVLQEPAYHESEFKVLK